MFRQELSIWMNMCGDQKINITVILQKSIVKSMFFCALWMLSANVRGQQPGVNDIPFTDQYPKPLFYFVANDTFYVQADIIDFTDDIIKYHLKVKTYAMPDTLCQDGFAINPYSRLNGGIEYGNDDRGEEQAFRPFYS